MREDFGKQLAACPTRWIEPPWKAILSNKGILPLLWKMFPRHPNLLPSFFDGDPQAADLGNSYVRKPLFSREGANVTFVSAGETVEAQDGPYGEEGFIRQMLMPLPDFSGQFPVIGSWIVAGEARGLSIREDDTDHGQHVTLPAARNSIRDVSRILPVRSPDAAQHETQ